jgi:hypothetical protein
MEDILELNIKYTNYDLLSLIIDKFVDKTYKKVFVVFLSMFVCVYIFIYIYLLVVYPDNKSLITNIPTIAAFPLILLFVLFAAIYKKYTILKKNFLKYNLFSDVKICFKTNIEIIINKKVYIYNWIDFKIIEDLENHIVFYYSEGLFLLVPRRCFLNQNQLDKFYIIINHFKPESYKNLQKFKLKISSPDFFKEDFYTDKVILSANVKLNLYHLLLYYINSFYKSIVGICITIILFVVIFIELFIYKNDAILYQSIFFMFIIPIILVFKAAYLYKKIPNKSYYCYKFSINFVLIIQQNIQVKLSWRDIKKYKDYGQLIVLHSFDNNVFIIPKKYLNDNTNNYGVLNKIFELNTNRKN